MNKFMGLTIYLLLGGLIVNNYKSEGTVTGFWILVGFFTFGFLIIALKGIKSKKKKIEQL